jgi:DNA-binding winged helix-turn-helix (wHTH) protein
MSRGTLYSFGTFEVDGVARRVTRSGEPLTLSDRQTRVLLHLLAHAGEVVSKDALIDAAWQDVAVTDNSLEQAISVLRRELGPCADGGPSIQTVPRQGYRFAADVTRATSRATDATLDALLAPHRAWIEGRAALETLEGAQVAPARQVFEEVLRGTPDQASAHVGLANACVLQYEMTRADPEPDRDALAAADRHAREACRLEPDYGEAWATLGFVLDRTGAGVDALAASRRAVSLEPDNWRHHLRLASVAWGEERLREAKRALALLPGSGLAHWMAATVYVARQAPDLALRELDAGVAASGAGSPSRFSGVALHWLRGLILLAGGDEAGAHAAFERELAMEAAGHLYARECCANAWYAIGALRLRRGERAGAAAAFREAVSRVAVHPQALAALIVLGDPGAAAAVPTEAVAGPPRIEVTVARAVGLALSGAAESGARLLDETLATTPPGSAAWFLPVEPLLRVREHPELWASALSRVQSRAS